MKRILVIGASGSGKSTLAQRIGQRLGLPYVPTDPFYWRPDWQIAPSERVAALLSIALAEPAWVLDGNFDDRREQVWPLAECIVWLDLSWPITIGRVIARNLGWAWTREPIWSGNRMTWRRALSGIRHAARSHGLKRRLYPGYLAELRGPQILRFTRSRDVQAWLAALTRPMEPG